MSSVDWFPVDVPCKLCGDTFVQHYTLGNRKVCYNKDKSKFAIITGNYFEPDCDGDEDYEGD